MALVGSFRKESLNQALIRAARGAARELVPERVRSSDFDLSTLPFYDGDLEAAGAPEEVAALKTAISSTDALPIATPEYNDSDPAVLKNAVDWASCRRPDSPLRDKSAAVMGASPSLGVTRRAQAHLREILQRSCADVVGGHSLYLARVFEHATDGRLVSEDVREALREIITGLVDAVVLDSSKTVGDAA